MVKEQRTTNMMKLILIAILGIVATFAADTNNQNTNTNNKNDVYYRNNPYNRNDQYYRNDYNRNNPYYNNYNGYNRNDNYRYNNYNGYPSNRYDNYNRYPNENYNRYNDYNRYNRYNDYNRNDYNRYNNYNSYNNYNRYPDNRNDDYSRYSRYNDNNGYYNRNVTNYYRDGYNPGPDAYARIIGYQSNIGADGNYEYSYQTENGISGGENGVYNYVEADNGGHSVKGYYDYKSPEGKDINVQYVADENGFRPQGNVIHPGYATGDVPVAQDPYNVVSSTVAPISK